MVAVVGYLLEGVIGSAVALQPSRTFGHAVVVPLGQALCLLPMTGELFDEVSRGDVVDPGFARCRLFPSGFERVLAGWSKAGSVAYVEADYFGGVGSQFAAVWQAGGLVLGPITTSVDAPPAAPGRSPISQAPRRLGVSAHGHVDEFDAVGLGRHRHTEDWLQDRP